jgi:hypothetical protein
MMTRAILIDPFTETIMDVTMVDTKLQTIKNLIDCEIITVAGIGFNNIRSWRLKILQVFMHMLHLANDYYCYCTTVRPLYSSLILIPLQSINNILPNNSWEKHL